MNIIYCIHGLKNSGGMERVITTKANYLAEFYGGKITIVTLNGSEQSFFKLHESIVIKSFCVDRLDSLRDYINKKKPDVFISTGGKEISILPTLSSHIKKIVEIHFCFYFSILREIAAGRGMSYRIYGFLKLLRYIFLLNFSDVVVSLTSKDNLRWRRCLPFTKTRTISNPVPFISNDQFSTSFLSDHMVIRFIAIGRLDNQKGFNDLVEICYLFKGKYKSRQWSVDIYGDGELKSFLLHKIEKLGLQEHVRIHDAVSNLAPIYQMATGLLMTSYYEGMPMVLLEALSFGTPCIAFDCDSGPSELIHNGHNGFLISKRNKHQFVSRMLDVAEMGAELFNDMSLNTLGVVEAYRIDRIMVDWIDLFRGKP
ncbi:glycosyltransferase [Aeromonas sp. S16(2024)]|uniref:glycosyltransferase n=1 Tax=Aeromonas sp. S16(2024) TaxID=3242889 RepID=UPI0035297967